MGKVSKGVLVLLFTATTFACGPRASSVNTREAQSVPVDVTALPNQTSVAQVAAAGLTSAADCVGDYSNLTKSYYDQGEYYAFYITAVKADGSPRCLVDNVTNIVHYEVNQRLNHRTPTGNVLVSNALVYYFLSKADMDSFFAARGNPTKGVVTFRGQNSDKGYQLNVVNDCAGDPVCPAGY